MLSSLSFLHCKFTELKHIKEEEEHFQEVPMGENDLAEESTGCIENVAILKPLPLSAFLLPVHVWALSGWPPTTKASTQVMVWLCSDCGLHTV